MPFRRDIKDPTTFDVDVNGDIVQNFSNDEGNPKFFQKGDVKAPKKKSGEIRRMTKICEFL